jgi:hypothetical protein
MSLPESLERAASELADLADQIRPANGDPHRLLEELNSAEAGRLLTWILNEDPEAAGELVVAWGEADDGAAVLVALSDDGIGKAGRKLLRKARHRLRSQGVEIQTPEPTKTKSRRTSGEADRWQTAHVSTPDFRGARVGYLVDSHPSGGARLFEIRFDETRGILDFKIYNAGRSKVRGFLRSLTQGVGQRLHEIEWDPLRALVRRASLAQPVDRPLPTSFVEWRTRLFSDEFDGQSTPGDLARAALGSKDDAEALEQGLETTMAEIRSGQLGPWPPGTAWVGEWMTTGREATADLEGDARGQAIEGWIGQASEALEKETDVALLAHLMDEMAWVRWKSDNEAGARALLAVSASVSTDDSVLRKVSRARIEGLFAPFLAELRVVEQSGLESADGAE